MHGVADQTPVCGDVQCHGHFDHFARILLIKL